MGSILLILLLIVLGLLVVVCRDINFHNKIDEKKSKYPSLDKDSLDVEAWNEFASNDVLNKDINKTDVFKKLMSYKSSERHLKDCTIENELVKYFLEEKVTSGSLVKPANFKISQSEYPEPVLLGISIPASLEKKSAYNFDACVVRNYPRVPSSVRLGSWDSCYANGWARLDKKSNRILIDIDSVVFSYVSEYQAKTRNLSLDELNDMGERQGLFSPKQGTFEIPIFRKVGFKVKGVVFNSSMEKGIHVDSSDEVTIKADAELVVQFERVEELKEIA